MKTGLALTLAAAVSAAGADRIVFVSPGGDDANAGTRASPLATAAGARDFVRRLRAGGDTGPFVVEFADGVYRIAEPLSLDARDSQVTWRAANRTKTVLSGAVVPKWKKANDDVLEAAVPGAWDIPGFTNGSLDDPAEAECPIGLYQDGRRLSCARWPNGEYARSGRSFGAGARTNEWGKGTFTSGDYRFDSPRLAAWSKERDLWVYGRWQYDWAELRSKMTAADQESGSFRVGSPKSYRYKFGFYRPFFVLNALCEMDEPGEWVAERDRRRVLMKQVPGTKNPAEIACATSLVEGTNLTGVVFSGFVFEKTRGDALRFADCGRTAVRSSVVRHTGGWGIKFSGARECDVRGCDLYDLGEGGISMAGGDRKTLTPSGNAADNNHICEYGKELSFYRPGVRLGGVGAKATHNLIHHADHQAISFTGNDHLVAYNVIHDVCRDTDDAGAIYTFARHDWSERGTIVEYNAIHMTGTQPRAHHVYGIYFDNHCSGNVARGNIISRVPTGIWASGGHSTVVEKNVIVNAQVPWARGNYGKPKTFPYLKRGRRGNLFLSVLRNPDCPERTLLERYPELAKILAVEDDQLAQAAIFTRFAANCYAASGHPMYRDWKVTGPYTTLSGNAEITGDPGFVDYRGFDWRLKPDSSVSKVTGGDCRFEKMGLYDDPLRVSKAVKFAADVSPPRPLDRCPEPSKPGIRLGVLIRGKMAKGEKAFARDFDGCQPEGAGRILATAGTPPFGQWREYSFSFVPDRDCTVDFEVEGSCGEKTLYDDFRSVGVEIAEPSFEQEGCWRLLDKPTAYYPPEKYDAHRFPIVNRDPPHGITGALAGLEGEIRPADGSKMGAANRDWRLVQKLELRKDVPVKIWLKARAYIPPDN